jgi:hypothetical protein
VYRGTDYEATCRIGNSARPESASPSSGAGRVPTADGGPGAGPAGGVEVRAIVQAVAWNTKLQVGDPVRVAWSDADVTVFPSSEEKDVIKYSVEAV